MTEIIIVRCYNNLDCEIAVEYCKNDKEVRTAVLQMLETIEGGDTITFESILE